jgi:hypothetical protein
MTFGPVFLNLTLGQNSLVLLVAALMIGQSLRPQPKRGYLAAALAWALAIAAKLFPLLWPGALPLLRRWRALLLMTLLALLTLGLTSILTPRVGQDYWLHFLPNRISSFSEQVALDDQSLSSWLDRLGRPHTFEVPTLSATQRQTVTWSPPWSLSPQTIRWTGYLLAALLGLIPLTTLLQTDPAEAEGAFYHVLLLPAMAWLWGRGRWERRLSMLAYLLAGLSRLNHLWALLLPAPWGPLASGFGLHAVLLLMGGTASHLWLQGTALRAHGETA